MNLRWFFISLVSLLLSLTGLLLYFAIKQGAMAFYIAEGALIISIFALLLFYGRIVKPIRTLSQGMDMLKMQDFSQRLKPVGQSEADSIAKTFNAIIAKLREEQIHTQEQEHFLKLLINNSSTAIILLDGNAKIHLANKSALELLGNDVYGKMLKDISSPVAAVMLSVDVRQTMTLPTQSGRLYKCTHQTFMDNGYAHHFYIIEDITADILSAQKTAYDKVIRMMSHEVNNTLTGILSTLSTINDTIKEDSSLKDFEEPVEACITRSSQLGSFISRIAQVVKIPDPVLKPTNVVTILRDAIKFTSSESEQKNINITLNTASETIIKGIDSQLLQQAVINILRNAMESIGSNGDISINATESSVTITDNGQGIQPEIAPNLFRPFFTTKKGGQGIGLMMIAEILTKHGFKYSLITNPETRLTTFSIIF